MNTEDIRELCPGMPHATEDVKWENDLAFSVGEKMFCVVGLNRTPTTVTFKAKDEEFDELCAKNGFVPAPYLARHKWVMVGNIEHLSEKEWKHYIGQSYRLVFDKLPPRKKKELG